MFFSNTDKQYLLTQLKELGGDDDPRLIRLDKCWNKLKTLEGILPLIKIPEYINGNGTKVNFYIDKYNKNIKSYKI